MKLKQFEEAIQKADFAVGDSFWIGDWEFEVVNTRRYAGKCGNNTSDLVGFDEKGKCLKCRSRVSFADVTDTLVYVGDEIIKRYEGDITNRNCVQCTYPEQYPAYKHYDDEPEPSGSGSRQGKDGDAKMNNSDRTTLDMEQYRCRQCKRMFYIHADSKDLQDVDFGCPYGCDDNGKHVRDLKAEVTETTDEGGAK